MKNVDGPLKTIAKGAWIALLGMFISKVLGYVYRIVVAHTGTEQYGLLTLGLAVVGVFSSISMLGLDKGVLRYVSFYKGREDFNKVRGIINSSIKITAISSIGLAIILFIFANQIANNIFHEPRLGIVFRLLAFAIPLGVISEIFLSSIKAFKKIKYEVVSKNLLNNIIKIVLTIFLIYIGLSLVGITLAYVLASLTTFILAFYFLEKKVIPFLKYKYKGLFNSKELLLFSWPLTISTLFILIMGWTDTIMIGYFKKISDVGVYNAALPTAQLLYVIPYSIGILVIPVLTELLSQNKNEEFKAVYTTATKWIFLINIAFLGMFILFSNAIMNILFGPEYIVGGTVLTILAVGYFVNYLFINCSYVLIIKKKTILEFINLLVGAIINIILNLLLIPKYGIVGAAIATSISFIIVGLLFLIESCYITKINVLKLHYFRIILSISLSLAAISFITKRIHNLNLLVLIILLIVLFTVYLILLLITKSFEKEDIMIISAINQKTGGKLNLIIKIIEKFSKRKP